MNPTRFVTTAVETGATALWVGASAGFAFVFAPIAFHLVVDREVFAELTERNLASLARLTYIAGGIAAASALGRAGFERDGRSGDVVRGFCGTAAVGCIAYHQTSIVPAMTRAQAAMGRFADVPQDDPQRVAYGALHQRSTRVYGTALLFGIIQLALVATRRPVSIGPAGDGA